MALDFPSRRLILFSGPEDWGLKAVRELIDRSGLKEKDLCWPEKNDAAMASLGQDYSLAVINAYQGLNPDVFGRLSGTVLAGGAVLIICPDLEAWSKFDDPAKVKLTPYPQNPSEVRGAYLLRWVGCIKQLDGVECLTPTSPQAAAIKTVMPLVCKSSAATPDQQLAIDAIIKVVTGQRRRPAIILADRGRGKSAALGMAAGQLLKEGKTKHIIVASNGVRQCNTLLKHAEAVLPDAVFNPSHKCLYYRDASLNIIAPDVLLSSHRQCDVLLIDEAATIGIARLEQLLIWYPRLAMATTEHGYEGSGRGFALRFKQLIGQHSRGPRLVFLKQAIRWGEDDPLERWTKQLLLLGRPQKPQNWPKQISYSALDFEPLSQVRLANDEAMLMDVFACLVDAHYQTKPSDLRLLLDAPNGLLWCAFYQGAVAGLVWVMLEGGLEGQLAREITASRRRPQGHLAPQILAAHLGIDQAVECRCARIQRIVVKPGLQRKGLGRWMLAELAKKITTKVDYLASSFGCNQTLLQFWQDSDYQIVRFSDQNAASSGLHSALVIKPISVEGERITALACNIFAAHFCIQLTNRLASLSPALIAEIHFEAARKISLAPYELKSMVLFAHGNLAFESCLSGLGKLALLVLYDFSAQDILSVAQRRLIIARILQGKPWKVCAEQISQNTGKAGCLVLLREAVRAVLQMNNFAEAVAPLIDHYINPDQTSQ